MNNFLYQNKTKVFFGKGGVEEYLGCILKEYGDTVMLAYGGGSIKQNGVYDEIMKILDTAHKRVVEFPGIMPNPTYTKVQEGAKLARENAMWILFLQLGADLYPTAVRLCLHRQSWKRIFGSWKPPSIHILQNSFLWEPL